MATPDLLLDRLASARPMCPTCERSPAAWTSAAAVVSTDLEPGDAEAIAELATTHGVLLHVWVGDGCGHLGAATISRAAEVRVVYRHDQTVQS